MSLVCLFELLELLYIWKMMVEHSCSKPDSVLQRILTLNSGPGLQNYSLFLCFHSVSNFLSPTFSLTLCFRLSLNKSFDGAPPPFHFPPPRPGAPDTSQSLSWPQRSWQAQGGAGGGGRQRSGPS